MEGHNHTSPSGSQHIKKDELKVVIKKERRGRVKGQQLLRATKEGNCGEPSSPSSCKVTAHKRKSESDSQKVTKRKGKR